MVIVLSKRRADANLLLTKVSKDPKLKKMLQSGNFDDSALREAVDYVSRSYSAGETQSEEAIKHLVRQHRLKRASFLSNRLQTAATEKLVSAVNQLIRAGRTRKAQTAGGVINIPPSDGNPTGKKIPVQQTEGQPAAEPRQKLSIDATPAATPDQKKEDLSKGVDDGSQSRQQQLINGTKALKISIGEVAKAMYGIELSDENADKCVSKMIEAIANCEAEQTSATVLSLLSPLIKQ